MLLSRPAKGHTFNTAEPCSTECAIIVRHAGQFQPPMLCKSPEGLKLRARRRRLPQQHTPPALIDVHGPSRTKTKADTGAIKIGQRSPTSGVASFDGSKPCACRGGSSCIGRRNSAEAEALGTGVCVRLELRAPGMTVWLPRRRRAACLFSFSRHVRMRPTKQARGWNRPHCRQGVDQRCSQADAADMQHTRCTRCGGRTHDWRTNRQSPLPVGRSASPRRRA